MADNRMFLMIDDWPQFARLIGSDDNGATVFLTPPESRHVLWTLGEQTKLGIDEVVRRLKTGVRVSNGFAWYVMAA